MPSSEFINIGLDVGYGQLKAAASKDNHLIIPSVVVELTHQEITNNNLTPDIVLEGRSYLVGQAAIDYGKKAQASPDSSYILSDSYEVLARYAIEQLTKDKDDKRPIRICTGLPVAFFKDCQKTVYKKMMRLSTAKNRVQQVSVLPQPIGSFLNVARDWEGNVTDPKLDTLTIAVVDIGHGTLDMYEQTAMRSNGVRVKGFTCGVHDLEVGLLARLKNAPGLKVDSYTVKQMGNVIRSGEMVINGRVESDKIQKHINAEKKILADKVLMHMDENWDQGYSHIYKIIFTGGGADILKEQIIKHVGKERAEQLLFPNESSLSNVFGFSKELLRIEHMKHAS